VYKVDKGLPLHLMIMCNSPHLRVYCTLKNKDVQGLSDIHKSPLKIIGKFTLVTAVIPNCLRAKGLSKYR
jgi:hypothetical protein